MDRTVVDLTQLAEELDAACSQVSSLYAAAASRIVVTSKHSFETSCGVHRLTGEVMAVDYVQPGESAALEAAVATLVGRDGSVDGLDEWSTMSSAAAIFDPDVLLAWLLTEGVNARH